MVITAQEKKLIVDSWSKLPGDLTSNGVIFMARMFDSNPEMKEIYKFLRGYAGDAGKHPFLPTHAGRIMRKIDISVHQLLSNQQNMLEDLGTLGSRHPGYGVNPNKHITPTLEAFIFMLRRQLGSAFTADLEDAWRRFFGALTRGMGLVV